MIEMQVRRGEPLNRAMRILPAIAVALLLLRPVAAQSTAERTIDRVKPSIVAVGTFLPTRQPQFRFLGTGFAVGDGTLIATNAHVVSAAAEPGGPESLVIVIPSRDAAQLVVREARRAAVLVEQDLALLRIRGPGLSALVLGDSTRLREGQSLLFTGFPLGGALGLIPATHRAMIAAITPIVLPAGNASGLDTRVIRQLRSGAFDILQLDAMAYPGSSGSPLYEPESGEVIGIVNMSVARTTKEANLPRPTGIAYAIPASHLQELMKLVE